jgi:hypothetical protein
LNVNFKEAIFDAGVSDPNGKVEGIRVFSKGIEASFKQLPAQHELAFDLACSINDFGVDLYTHDPKFAEYKI